MKTAVSKQIVRIENSAAQSILDAVVTEYEYIADYEGEKYCFLCTPKELDELLTGHLISLGKIETKKVYDQGEQAQFEAEDIFDRVQELEKASQLFIKTGGAHCWSAATREEIIISCEDVGRHNALDKLIGHIHNEQINLADKILLSSGRLSAEMIQKVMKVNGKVVASISAPTDRAIELSEKGGITLIGFARGNRMNIYTHPQRIIRRQ